MPHRRFESGYGGGYPACQTVLSIDPHGGGDRAGDPVERDIGEERIAIDEVRKGLKGLIAVAFRVSACAASVCAWLGTTAVDARIAATTPANLPSLIVILISDLLMSQCFDIDAVRTPAK